MASLGLGSVQWGQGYGVTHEGGPPEAAEVGTILARAAAAGVRVIDTAPSYGDAEAKLGKLAPPHAGFSWVTKTAAPAGEEDILVEGVARSRKRLGTLYGLLDHFPDELEGPAGPRRMQRLEDLRARGWVQKVGVSVYGVEQVEAVLGGAFPQLVQLPFNVLDRRFLEDGMLETLSRLGVEVHARSVFLQGLLLVDPQQIPEALAGLRDPVAAFQAVAKRHGLSPLEAALGFVLSCGEIEVALCGVQSAAELAALLRAAERGARVDPHWFEGLPRAGGALLDPRSWPACDR